MAKKFETTAILDLVYPIVEKALDTNYSKWKHCMSEFIQKRSSMLFDIAPFDRIYYNDIDRDTLFTSLGINRKDIRAGMKETYYWNMSPFKPASAKDETTIVVMCIVRYFMKKKNQKDLDLAMIYQAFTGKYYPSIHYGFFKLAAPSKYRHIMEYVVNHMLSQKFDLKSKGSVIGAIKSINETWLKTYTKNMNSYTDEDITYMIQQLHNRIKSFMKNIANMYYEAYKNKDFITYDKDSLPEEGDGSVYHLATNDSLKLNSYVENTMTLINTTRVDVKVCKDASDGNVSAEEIRNIMEAIFGDKEQLPRVKEFIELVIASFLASSTVKDVNSVQFVQFCIKPKPNTKDPTVLRAKDLIDEFLDDVSIAYRKRKHRNATKQSYHRAFNYYFCAIIIKANR
jgi:hypothetical protein